MKIYIACRCGHKMKIHYHDNRPSDGMCAVPGCECRSAFPWIFLVRKSRLK